MLVRSPKNRPGFVLGACAGAGEDSGVVNSSKKGCCRKESDPAGERMTKAWLSPSILVGLVLALAPPAWADFQAGLGAYNRGDYGTALKEFRPLAEQGNASAQVFLGAMYAKGQGVLQDDGEAIKWYRLAAEQGLALAQYHLGYRYEKGLGVPQDFQEAVRWFQSAADQGDVSAQYYLGYMYAEGLGVPQDYGEAIRWFWAAAEQGDASAQYYLGYMYANGLGVWRNTIQAYMWVTVSAAQGFENAEKGQEFLEKKMTPNEIAEAQRLAQEWKPKKP